ncbi:GH92 family glycosyl hydrolase [Dysgonomonas sp. Marseille-P4677]|uniref:GH92 family glycosyl hydrolase n=1 Tax=Dysgonomonas sp. Marseille-P4677 TaxID=2364790 RepID=UPI0019127050|nr:GH92 family glycosyl hydrolase [Dysgonomonas sp. Marseille-P4677]MBK5720589.1 GH92 family glycosyl hydrolase [Dysgonomonas sp. Marseille-P4677]
MKIGIITLSLVLMGGMVSAQDNKVSFVNPMIGTVKMGHTFPGACVPHGIVQLSPDTDTIPHSINGVYQKDTYKYCAGYQHDDKTIVGFSHTHLSGTGHSDLGDILVIPVTGALKFNPGTADNPESGYRSRFSHDTEVAHPGYYEVVLDDYKVKAQLTATERVGIHKYTYPANEEQKLLLDLTHGIYNYDGKVLWASLRVENDTLITGYRITNGWARENYTYFAISLSKPIKNYGYVDKEKPKYTGFWRKFNLLNNFPEIAGRKIVAHLEFDSDASKPLVLKVALSGVSTQGALINLEAETKDKSFDQIVAEASNKWNKVLDVIDVIGDNDKKTMFYTSLYHTMINPSVYMDVDGQYRGIDHNIHKAKGFTNYTIFSVWDTYRALHPLFNLINRERSVDIVNSMLAHYEQSVHKALPVWSHMGNENWCMIGYHSVSVLADALDKGLNIDKQKAFEAMINSSNVDYYDGTGEYKKLGYVPVDKNGSGSSITLEYSYDDWTIYNTALKMDNQAVAETYRKRALNYHNVFDPELEFVRARYSDGRWKTPFNLLSTHGEGFIEGNSWNYSFYVPHDVKGLIKQMGGDKQFVQRLDSLFTMHLPDEFFADTEDVTREGVMGNYVHGNEPSHHIAYLYAWTSQPWKTQYWVREIMNRMYRNSIDGLCGNDDCGQMSAWYIFSAMGFYPVCPGSNEYVLGAPYFPYMKVKVGEDKYLEIKADKVSDKMRYIKSVKLNGKPYTKSYITYDDIKNGAEITFEMSATPNKKRLFNEDEKPYSLSKH